MEQKNFKNLHSETMRPIDSIFSKEQCLVVPRINPAYQGPGVQSGPALGIKNFHRINNGKKTLKILLSETMTPTAYICSI